MTNKKEILYRFRRAAKTYDNASDIQRVIADHLIRYCPNLDSVDSARILEIGAGTGHLTQRLLEKYNNASLLITNDTADSLEICKGKCKPLESQSVEFYTMDGENIPDKVGKFDLIVSSMAVQWFDDPEGSITAWKDRLKPNGAIVLSTLHEDNWPEWNDAINESGMVSKLIDAPFLPKQMDVDVLSLTKNYGNAMGFLRSLRNTGATTPKSGSEVFDKHADLMGTISAYDDKYNGDITWNIAMAQWKP